MKNKIKNRGEKAIILLIAIFQIILLIGMSPADSYRIYQTDSLIKDLKIIEGEDKIGEIIDLGINLLIGFLSIKQIGTVSATEADMWCCPEMKNGAKCADILSTDTESCKVGVIETSCDITAECRKGCCFDTEEGLCSTNSPKKECESKGGEWSDDKSCSLTKCRKGCCVLGSNVRFTTERNCEKISAESGFNKDFRQIWNELDCIALSASQSEGACLLKGGICKFGTETECLSKKGTFYKDYLCSNMNLGTRCTRQASIRCASGKDEIYWFDSCGNRENIYSSDRDASWNNGIVLKKSESCNDGSGSIESASCGNCGRPTSKCFEVSPARNHVQDGNFICRDLGCENAPDNVGTKDRYNGEKWCLYDSYIGNGKDTVGSEHWLAYCHDGEVEIDRCEEYRGSLCEQQIIEEGGKSFSMASCTINHASLCMTYNPLQEKEDGQIVNNEGNIKNCEDDKNCMIKHVELSSYFKFDTCVPRYPKGANLKDGMDDNICGIADTTCTVYYEKNVVGVWGCKENCACETAEFAGQINDLCVSLGDCGSYINYKGQGSENVEIKGKKGNKLDSNGEPTDASSDGMGEASGSSCLSHSSWMYGPLGIGLTREEKCTKATYTWTGYQSYKNPVDGQYVEPQDIDEFLAQFGGSGGDFDPADAGEILTWAGAITGAAGGLFYAAMQIFPTTFFVPGAVGAAAFTVVGQFATVAFAALVGIAA